MAWKKWNRIVQLSTCTGLLWSTGCYSFRDGFTEYPPGAMPAPVGTYTRQWQAAHRDQAAADDLVLYEASWIDGSDRLGPAAKDRLARLASACDMLPPVVIEPSDDEGLDARRIEAVVQTAGRLGIELTPEQIVIATADGQQLYGEEAYLATNRMFRGRQTRRNGFGDGGTGGFLNGGGMSGVGSVSGGIGAASSSSFATGLTQ